MVVKVLQTTIEEDIRKVKCGKGPNGTEWKDGASVDEESRCLMGRGDCRDRRGLMAEIRNTNQVVNEVADSRSIRNLYIFNSPPMSQ